MKCISIDDYLIEKENLNFFVYRVDIVIQHAAFSF